MHKITCRFTLTVFICSFVFFFILPQEVFSANFSVSPVRIFFDGKNRTSILTIKNESEEILTLQLRAYKWQQDEEGKDIYSPTKDIIFFPKIFKVQNDEEKIIRLGTKIPQGLKEKTFRLYIEEIPEPRPVETTAVRILVKVGVPVFILPLKAETKGAIEKAELLKGSLFITVKNKGNSHFIIRAVKVKGSDASGKEVFSNKIGGWYLHEDNSKDFSFEIPADNCLKIKTLKININTDKFSMDKKLDVSKEMCTL